MTKQILRGKSLLVTVLLLAFIVSCSSSAFAWGGHGGGGHGGYGGGGHGGYGGGGHGGGGYHGHYYYHGDHWYGSGWFWGGFGAALTVGTIVAALPPYYDTFYVGGAPYYYYDSVYYRPYSTGYIVVPTPTPASVVVAPAATAVEGAPAVTQPQATSTGTAVINIPNANGGYTPVTLTKHKTGYIGPQGEYYEGHPTVEQLRVLYGN